MSPVGLAASAGSVLHVLSRRLRVRHHVTGLDPTLHVDLRQTAPAVTIHTAKGCDNVQHKTRDPEATQLLVCSPVVITLLRPFKTGRVADGGPVYSFQFDPLDDGRPAVGGLIGSFVLRRDVLQADGCRVCAHRGFDLVNSTALTGCVAFI